ncbi:hypothetical protein F2981_05030 [Sinorhizobium meliloti]|nr:hypothetical protein [Sinorhizobium meliloti]
MLFQMTFAATHPGAHLGAFAERNQVLGRDPLRHPLGDIRHFPIAHMVWDANRLSRHGRARFRRRTRGPINAGVAGLVGAFMVGKRTRLRPDMMAPPSMTLTLVALPCCGSDGSASTAGSNLEASGGAVLAHRQHLPTQRLPQSFRVAVETPYARQASMLVPLRA